MRTVFARGDPPEGPPRAGRSSENSTARRTMREHNKKAGNNRRHLGTHRPDLMSATLLAAEMAEQGLTFFRRRAIPRRKRHAGGRAASNVETAPGNRGQVPPTRLAVGRPRPAMAGAAEIDAVPDRFSFGY